MTGTYLPRLSSAELEELSYRFSDDEDRPILVGLGPAEFSTSLALEPFPSIIWDVNNYYWDLGVSVHASRREIRDRFLAVGGHSNKRLTMIAKTLLNRDLRQAYDLMPLGSTYMDEEEIMKIRLAAVEMAGDSSMSDEYWFPDEELTQEELDQQMNALIQQIEHRQKSRSNVGRDHSWSYYLYLCPPIHTLDSMNRLCFWRMEIARQCREHGVSPTLAVGFIGGPFEYAVIKVGYRHVLFLGVTTPVSDVIASKAVQQLLSE